ncbi:MAG: hypothetical protein D3922_07410 [Candidatus Electrothrix sp. AR1]|nr:hypothetical protein [Candidatus Electrothrix sp. AR1]
MGWGRDWPEREPRPKVKKLSKEEKATIQKSLENGIHASPVLTALQYRVRSARGRFYYEQYLPDEEDFEMIARATPLVTPENVLLLETEYEKGRWKEITQPKFVGIVLKKLKIALFLAAGPFQLSVIIDYGVSGS